MIESIFPALLEDHDTCKGVNYNNTNKVFPKGIIQWDVLRIYLRN